MQAQTPQRGAENSLQSNSLIRDSIFGAASIALTPSLCGRAAQQPRPFSSSSFKTLENLEDSRLGVVAKELDAQLAVIEDKVKAMRRQLLSDQALDGYDSYDVMKATLEFVKNQ